MKDINRRRWLEILLIVGVVVLVRVGIVLVDEHIGNATGTNTTSLPVHSGNATIAISNQEFRPNVIVVTSGSKITWVNHDPMAHTVTEGQDASSTPHGFNSSVLLSGKSWSYVFSAPGTYLYTCRVSPKYECQGHRKAGLVEVLP